METSRLNFTPRIGFGESTLVGTSRNLDFEFKVVHISNSGLGDSNPGVNFTFQRRVGYWGQSSRFRLLRSVRGRVN